MSKVRALDLLAVAFITGVFVFLYYMPKPIVKETVPINKEKCDCRICTNK